MRHLLYALFLLTMQAFSSSALAHGDKEKSKHEDKDHSHEKDSPRENVGPDKGVLEADEKRGFLLRDGVEARFGIKTIRVNANDNFHLAKDALVVSREDYQVFRKREGYWLAVDVKVLKKGDPYLISSPHLKAGDDIAISSSGLLKIIESSVFGPAIEGHIH